MASNSLIRRGTLDEERRLQEDIDAQEFDRLFKRDSPTSPTITGAASRTPPSEIPNLSAPTPTVPGLPATFENVQGANIGQGPDEIRLEDFTAAGGTEGIFETQRPSIPFEAALSITDNLLGRVSDSQLADVGKEGGLKDLSTFQSMGLFLADVMAISKGQSLPSANLDVTRFRARTLSEQAEGQSFLQGLKAQKDLLDLVRNSPKDQRSAITAALIPQMEALSPNLGAITLSLASNNNEREALDTFVSNPDLMGQTDAARAMSWVTAMGGVDAHFAAQIMNKMIDENVFSNTVDNLGPSIIAQLKDVQIEAARRQGGAQEDFANRWASGAKMTPTEYETFNAGLPEKLKTPLSVMESYGKDRNRYFSTFPGQYDESALKVLREAGIKAEYSTPITLVNPADIGPARAEGRSPQIASGPGQNGRMQQLMLDGWVIAKLDRTTTGEAGGPGDLLTGPFEQGTVATITDMQKQFTGLRVANDELHSIRESFSKDLLTNQAKLKDFGLGIAEAFGKELTPENAEFRQRFVSLQTKALDALNKTLNRLSGAAVSPPEYDRIALTMPNPNMDPGRFQIVMNTRIDEMNFGIARFNVYRLTGGNKMGEQFNLTRSDVRSFIVERLAALTTSLGSVNPGLSSSSPEIQAQAAEHLANELGLAAEDLYRLFPKER